ncbi:MAG: PLP-dependent aminotransferase family protein [Candidatus Promineifilaceae bacterium]|nr:PLP-dependent aminotransferase family protein [Candidatus Promineifilaceae bacterium]
MQPTKVKKGQVGEIALADWARTMERSVLRQMIGVVSRPGILSFAGGLPAPEYFPREAYAAALARVLAEDENALQYRPPFAPLRRHVVDLMGERGVACTPEQVFITTGAQQALDVLTRLLLNPGGQVMLEEIVYTGIQQAVAPFRPEILPVPTDLETGIDVDAVEGLLAAGARPAFLYVIPEAQNPLGVSITPEKRRRLVAVARANRLPIVEDDPYGFLAYDGEAAPPLKALEPDWVFYVGSFSKLVAPALRLGWMVAPEALVPRLTVVKEAGDLETSALTQRAVSAFLDDGHLPDHLDLLRRVYGRRRDAMLEALNRTFPAGVRWTTPAAGMFVWVELPSHLDTMELLQAAIEEEQVAFIPGRAFSLPGLSAGHCLRLCFANADVPAIEDGIERLARVVRRFVVE